MFPHPLSPLCFQCGNLFSFICCRLGKLVRGEKKPFSSPYQNKTFHRYSHLSQKRHQLARRICAVVVSGVRQREWSTLRWRNLSCEREVSWLFFPRWPPVFFRNSSRDSHGNVSEETSRNFHGSFVICSLKKRIFYLYSFRNSSKD